MEAENEGMFVPLLVYLKDFFFPILGFVFGVFLLLLFVLAECCLVLFFPVKEDEHQSHECQAIFSG